MDKKKRRIRFWAMPNAGFETKGVLTKELTEFTTLYPNIEVEISIISWSTAWQKLIQIIKRNRDLEDAPDVVQIGSTWQGTLSCLGGLADLSRFAEPALLEDFIEPLLLSCYSRQNQCLFSIPWFSDLRILYYRKDYIRKLNFTEKNFSCWDDFVHILHEMKRHFGKKIAPMSLSGQSEMIQMHDVSPWIWSSGADFFDVHLKKSMLYTERAKSSIQFYFDLIDKEYIPITGRDWVASGNFFTGDSIFQISGTWPVQSLLNPKSKEYCPQAAEHLGMSVLPAYSKEEPATTFIGGSHLAILASSRYIEESWSLIRFLTEKVRQENHAKKAGVLPAKKSSFEPLFFGKSYPEAHRVFAQAIRHSKTFPALPVLGSVEQVIRNFTQNLLDAIRLDLYTRETASNLCQKVSAEMDVLLSLYE
jgi:ABC-type glycerol-3-phosphate transport system substrate-binding protein